MKTEPSKEALKYLKEVFGFDNVKAVDRLTWEVIFENATDKTAPGGNGYPLDKELVACKLLS